MRCFLEKAGTKVRPVQRVVNHAAHINSPDSAHDGILPHRSRRKKVPDTFSPDVAAKDDIKKLQGQMGMVLGLLKELKLSEKVPEVFEDTDLGRGHSRKLGWILGIGIPVAALLVAIVAWIQPQISAHLARDRKNDTDNEIAAQLKDPLKKLDDIAGDVREIKGKLSVLDPMIQRLTAEQMQRHASLSPQEFQLQLPKFKDIVGLSPGVRQTVKTLFAVRWNCIVLRRRLLAKCAPAGEAEAGSAGVQPAKE